MNMLQFANLQLTSAKSKLNCFLFQSVLQIFDRITQFLQQVSLTVLSMETMMAVASDHVTVSPKPKHFCAVPISTAGRIATNRKVSL